MSPLCVKATPNSSVLQVWFQYSLHLYLYMLAYCYIICTTIPLLSCTRNKVLSKTVADAFAYFGDPDKLFDSCVFICSNEGSHLIIIILFDCKIREGAIRCQWSFRSIADTTSTTSDLHCWIPVVCFNQCSANSTVVRSVCSPWPSQSWQGS